MLNAEKLAMVDAWRFERRLSGRSDAVRQLLRLGQYVPGSSRERSARSV